tara:strand:- start:828 stop:1262 length:435 start_codon:yes stop_codon:yes gene_type:complete
MGTEIRLKATSRTKKDITSGTLETKMYDGGDASLIKKYSRIHITYSIDGVGASPLEIHYKTDDNYQWKTLEPSPNNPNAIKNTHTKLKRTGGKLSTAELIIPGKAKARSIAVRLYLRITGADGTDFKNFKLSDITFTFRTIIRK